MKDKERKTPKVPSISLDASTDRDDPHPSDKSRGTSYSQMSHHQGNGADCSSGLLSTKRLVKRMSRGNSDRRDSVFHGSHQQTHVNNPVPKMEPTYQLEPKYTFSACAVERIVKSVLKTRVEGINYDAEKCGRLSSTISEDIKDRVKLLKYDRYKIICYVTMGENKGQCVTNTSRCAWDPKCDSFASYTVTTKEMFCTACVFGVYTD